MRETDAEPLRLETVADWVHHDLATSFIGARILGPAARVDGQRVGRDHAVLDGDVVEIQR